MIAKTNLAPLLLLAPILAWTSCNGKEASAAEGGAARSVSLTGRGASFPAPLYARWFKAFSQQHPNVRIDYQSAGSSVGVQSTIDGLVDFGASDAAMSDEEMAKVGRGVQLLPMTAGAIVITYNLEGVSSLRLSREALAGIFLGEITTWNDPVLKAANPGTDLPDRKITVVRRADGSGTTFVFTSHLSGISPKWQQRFGANKSIAWPEGFLGGKGNEGVAANVKQTPGSLGYVEYGFAVGGGLQAAALQNKAGQFVTPTNAAFQSALDGMTLPVDLRAWLPDPEGTSSYPIVSYTWILAYKTYPKDKLQALQQLFDWCLTEGQKFSAELGYVPLSTAVSDRVRAAVGGLKAGE